MVESDIYDLSIQAINEKRANRMPAVMRELTAARKVVEAARHIRRRKVGVPGDYGYVYSVDSPEGDAIVAALASYDAARNSTSDQSASTNEEE